MNFSYHFKKFQKLYLTSLIIFFVLISAYFIYSYFYQSMPQPSIYFLNEVNRPAKDRKVLIFSPHPDDETIGCGGYIHDAEKNGARVEIVLVTDGNKHGLKEKRYEEFRKVTQTLGVPGSDLIFLNHSDGKLKELDSKVLQTEFDKIITDYKPDVVFSPDNDDLHPDHATVGKEVTSLLKANNYTGSSYKYLIHYANYPRPVKYSPDDYLLPPIKLVTFENEWQRYDLSSETEDVKNQAILNYHSQLYTPFLRGLVLSSIRKNELFLKEGK